MEDRVQEGNVENAHMMVSDICTIIQTHMDLLDAVAATKASEFETKDVVLLTPSEQKRVRKSLMNWFSFIECVDGLD